MEANVEYKADTGEQRIASNLAKSDPVRQALAQSFTPWQEMREQANVLLRSGFLPVHIKKVEQALAIAIRGRELGLPMMEALNNLYIAQGKVTCQAQLILALIYRSGQLENLIVKHADASCTVTMKRRGGVTHTETFSMDDAEALGLANKDNYKKQGKTMLKWRAISACARVVFPDVIGGLYSHEELGLPVKIDVEENVVLDGEAVQVEPEQEAGDSGNRPDEQSSEREKPAGSATPSPLCPKCGSAMRERTKKSDGGKFWGCSKYPDCKGTLSHSEPEKPDNSNEPEDAGAVAVNNVGAAPDVPGAAPAPLDNKNDPTWLKADIKRMAALLDKKPTVSFYTKFLGKKPDFENLDDLQAIHIGLRNMLAAKETPE